MKFYFISEGEHRKAARSRVKSKGVVKNLPESLPKEKSFQKNSTGDNSQFCHLECKTTRIISDV